MDPDGTIHYEHEHIRKGVIVEVMNLLHPDTYATPDGRILNSAMAERREIRPVHWVSGDLWDSFGDVLRNRRHFALADDEQDPPADVLLAMRAPAPW